MGVYELSGAGSLKTPRTVYSSMNANNGNSYGAMVPIANQNITPGTSSITFNDIPQIYQDLYIVISGYKSSLYTGNSIWPRFNSDAGTNYSSTTIRGTGVSADSFRGINGTQITLEQTFFTDNTPSTIVSHVFNYANTTRFKTALFRVAADANGSGQTYLTASLWRSTAAINSFQFVVPGGNSQLAGGTATIYGIKAVAS